MNQDSETLTFPDYLDVIKQSVFRQFRLLKKVSEIYADTIGAGRTIHVYANRHSRVSAEELIVRMRSYPDFICFSVLQ